MNKEQLKENVIRSEGFSEGFKAGYLACANHIAIEMQKEEQEKKKKESIEKSAEV